MFILRAPHTLQRASPDGITQVLDLGVDSAEVYRPVQRLVPVHAAEAVHAVHSSEVRGKGQVGVIGDPKLH